MTPRKCCSSNHRQEGDKEGGKVFLAFTELRRHSFPHLLPLLVESGYGARKPHSPIFWLLLIKAVSINRWWHVCKVLSQCHVALGGSQSWEQRGSEPAATPVGKQTELVRPLKWDAREEFLQSRTLFSTNTV